jgi:hypothetical protein
MTMNSDNEEASTFKQKINAIGSKYHTPITLLGLLITVFIFYIFGLTVHEYWHLRIADCFGISGYINFTWFGGVFVTHTIPTEPDFFLIKLAGGLGTAVVMAFLWAYARWTCSKWDLNIEFATALIGSIHLVYGIFEGLFLGSGSFTLISVIAMAVVSVVVSVIYLDDIVEYIQSDNS